MKQTRNRRGGFTITELAVVLAVLAIVITMVASFDALMHHRRAASQARLDAMNDIKVAEALIEAHIENAEKKNEAIKIAFGNEGLTVGETKMALEKVTDITLNTTESNGDKIYFCTITYTLSEKDGKTDTYTFCVDPTGGSAG